MALDTPSRPQRHEKARLNDLSPNPEPQGRYRQLPAVMGAHGNNVWIDEGSAGGLPFRHGLGTGHVAHAKNNAMPAACAALSVGTNKTRQATQELQTRVNSTILMPGMRSFQSV